LNYRTFPCVVPRRVARSIAVHATMCRSHAGPGRRVYSKAVVRTRFQASTRAGAKTRNATPLRLGFAPPPRLLVCAIGSGQRFHGGLMGHMKLLQEQLANRKPSTAHR
jgi:hypothetical protein